MLDEFPWSICVRKWKWLSNQTFSQWVCLKTGRREYSFTLRYDKIILHRIISVVWLTNFLSEIRSLSNHDDETKFHILSVKPSRKFSFSEHWWSLIALYCAVMDVKQSEWPLHIISTELVPTLMKLTTLTTLTTLTILYNFDDSDRFVKLQMQKGTKIGRKRRRKRL